jgi:GTP cyclohydrolase FolE2
VITAENQESIHDHNAYALLERSRLPDGSWR